MLRSGTIAFSYGNTTDCVTCILGNYTQTRDNTTIDESGPSYVLFKALKNVILSAHRPLPFIARLGSRRSTPEWNCALPHQGMPSVLQALPI